MITWREAHLKGAVAAGQVRASLGIRQDELADPVSALESLGVVVLRRPLAGLAGAYLPTDLEQNNAPGVVVNSNHPESKQRYTCAHELAHHVLHQEIALDVETEWMARNGHAGSASERVAEAFAAWFLMPRRLLRNVLDTVASPEIDGATVYQVALRLGTSFAATAWHMAATRIISLAEARAISSIEPAALKNMLVGDDAPPPGRHDVWRLGERDVALAPAVQDILAADLHEDFSTVFEWEVHLPDGIVQILDRSESLPTRTRFGGGHVRRVLLSVTNDHAGEIRLVEKRPWEQSPISERTTTIAPHEVPGPGLADPGQVIPELRG